MQFELPHLQSVPTVFEVIPLVIGQVVGGRGEHELEDSTQYDSVEHPALPQRHAAGLAVIPLI